MFGLNLEKWVEPLLVELSENPEAERRLTQPRTWRALQLGPTTTETGGPHLLRKGDHSKKPPTSPLHLSTPTTAKPWVEYPRTCWRVGGHGLSAGCGGRATVEGGGLGQA